MAKPSWCYYTYHFNQNGCMHVHIHVHCTVPKAYMHYGDPKVTITAFLLKMFKTQLLIIQLIYLAVDDKYYNVKVHTIQLSKCS
jgi:hypothetical protein